MNADKLVEALREIADFDCGCMPCTGQCRKGEAAEYELEARMEIARQALAEYDAQPANANAEQQLKGAGVFKGEHGLRGLLDAKDFWEQQPYGTRLYYGGGIADYLHRGVLKTAVSLLDAQPAQAAQLVRYDPNVPDQERLLADARSASRAKVAAQPSADAEDAARYRWLRSQCTDRRVCALCKARLPDVRSTIW